jgi:hypothetical protein
MMTEQTKASQENIVTITWDAGRYSEASIEVTKDAITRRILNFILPPNRYFKIAN